MPKKLLYLLVLIFFPFRIFAWGRAGHQMVAELAMNRLSDATRAKVERVLNGMTPAKAGTWMDEVRSDPKYRYMAPWHFVNIERGGTYKPAPKGDMITALNKAYTELQHREELTPEQVKFDVLVLFHLCGDLLQPLHAGYGSDKGGNTYQVQYKGKGTNLHSIWDSRIIEKEQIKLADLGTGQKVKGKPVKFMIWLNESRGLLPQVYNLKNRKADDSYLKKNKTTVITQLKDGGLLLADCLETLFGKISKVSAGSLPLHRKSASSPKIPVKRSPLVKPASRTRSLHTPVIR